MFDGRVNDEVVTNLMTEIWFDILLEFTAKFIKDPPRSANPSPILLASQSFLFNVLLEIGFRSVLRLL